MALTTRDNDHYVLGTVLLGACILHITSQG